MSTWRNLGKLSVRDVGKHRIAGLIPPLNLRAEEPVVLVLYKTSKHHLIPFLCSSIIGSGGNFIVSP